MVFLTCARYDRENKTVENVFDCGKWKKKKKLLYPALRFESSLSQYKGETTVGGCFLRSAIKKSGLTGHLCLVRRR